MGQVSLHAGNINVEFDEITVELVVTVLQESVVLALELLDEFIEFLNNFVNVLKVVLLKSSELLDGAEKVDQLANTSLEEVEAAENLSGGEVELLGLGHVLETLLGELVLGLVGLVESLALLHDIDELIMGDDIGLPEDGVVQAGASFLRFGGFAGGVLLEGQDVHLAVDDHLVGDLDEEAGHAFVGVVVASDGVDHLDGVHQDGEGLLDCNWIAIIKGLNEALEGLEVLYVVLGLVEVLSDSQLDGSPVGESEVNAAVSVAVSLVGRSGSEHVTDGLAVLRLQLLGNGGEHAHAEFPVFKLVTGTFVLLVDALVVLLVNGRLDLD